MPNAYQFKKRHIVVDGKETTVSIEQLYWSAIDLLAGLRGQSPSKLLQFIIAIQPPEYENRAGWIRYCVTGQCFIQLRKTLKVAGPSAD